MKNRKISLFMVLVLLFTMNMGVVMAEETVPPQIETPEPPGFNDLPEFPGQMETQPPTTAPPTTAPPTSAPPTTAPPTTAPPTTAPPTTAPPTTAPPTTAPPTSAPPTTAPPTTTPPTTAPPTTAPSPDVVFEATEKVLEDLSKDSTGTLTEEKLESVTSVLSNTANAFKGSSPEQVKDVSTATVIKTLEIIKSVDADSGDSMKSSLEAVVKAAVDAVGTVQIKQVQNEPVVVSKDTLLEKAAASQELGASLSALSEGMLSKPVERKVSLSVETDENNALELDLPELEEVFSVVDVVEIETPMGAVSISKDIFASGEVPSKVVVKEVPKEDLPAELQNVKVINFEIYRASEEASEFQKPVVVSVPFMPENQGDENFLTAFYLDDNGVSTPVPGYFENGVFIFKTNHFSKYYIGMNKVEFKDLTEGWSLPYVQSMAAKGIIKGKSEGIFDPEADVTRAEFITLISRVLNYGKSKIVLPYEDVVSKDWFHDPVQMLYDAGILETANSLNPNEAITREEMGTILGKTLLELGYNQAQKTVLARFSDMDQMSGETALQIATAVQNKILEGSNGMFSPKDNMTRAQAATVIYRLISK